MLPTQFSNVFDMAEKLPFFEVRGGDIMLSTPLPHPVVDCHAHLGWTYLLAGTVDYWREFDTTETFWNKEKFPVNLSVYTGVDFHHNDANALLNSYLKSVIKTRREKHESHTAANLLREMQQTGITHTVILAIDFPVFSHTSEDALAVYEKAPNLIPFVSVHPKDRRWPEKLEAFIAGGARGLKVHGEIQGVAIDDPAFLAVYARWNKTGLPVLVHTGVSDMQPKWLAGNKIPRSHLSRMDKVAEALEDCPVMLGHGGMNQYRDTIALTRRHKNLIAELDGQPPEHLLAFFDEAPTDQLVWGSDWPVYPQALQLAKLLIATEGAPDIRRAVLWENPKKMLKLDEPEAP